MTLLRYLTALVLIGIVGLLAFVYWPVSRTPAQSQVAADFDPSDHADYAMRIADCGACHTAEGGVPFAGGRAIVSPLGTIYSSNITPDNATGIGNYTLDQFRAALYDGVDAEGHNLYPAMPYSNYRAISEEDVQRLYSYFHDQLEPVNNPVQETELPFPFNQRWGLRAWKWVALPDPGFGSDPSDPVVARGAYLVEGPGHCGACHSPRTALFKQAGYTASEDGFLTGGEIAGWTAPPLRGDGSALSGWSQDDIRQILATARNAHAAINGEMQLVVRDSTQYMSDDDLNAMAAYLVTLNGGTPVATDAAPPASTGQPEGFAERLTAGLETETEQLLASADPAMPLGARLYIDNCNACHFADGGGADGVFPSLAGNSLVTANSPVGLISMILAGSELPSTKERPYALRMPGFGDRLSDTDAAELASFVRNGWGNSASSVDAAAVAELRGNTNTAPK